MRLSDEKVDSDDEIAEFFQAEATNISGSKAPADSHKSIDDTPAKVCWLTFFY